MGLASGDRRVRCNVYVCNGCANGFRGGEVVGVRAGAPGEWVDDEMGSSDEVVSEGQSKHDSPSPEGSWVQPQDLAEAKEEDFAGAEEPPTHNNPPLYAQHCTMLNTSV